VDVDALNNPEHIDHFHNTPYLQTVYQRQCYQTWYNTTMYILCPEVSIIDFINIGIHRRMAKEVTELMRDYGSCAGVPILNLRSAYPKSIYTRLLPLLSNSFLTAHDFRQYKS